MNSPILSDSVQKVILNTPSHGGDIPSWIVISAVVFVFSLASFLITFLAWYLIRFQKQLETIKSDFSSFREGISDKSNEILSELGSLLDDHKSECISRNMDSAVMTKERFDYVEVQIKNICNLIFEILDKFHPLVASTSLAVQIFEAVMYKHCMEKSNMIAEAIIRKQYPTEQLMLDSLSIRFRNMTEEEVRILNGVVYENGNRVGDVLERFLEKDTWNNFINTTVRGLIDFHITETNQFVIQGRCFNALWEYVVAMTRQIRELGKKQ